MHYQLRRSKGKLVCVVHGAVFDVAVDVRGGSPSFGRWVGHELSEANAKMMWVPPGFAHGFPVLSETADFLYKCTDFYAPEFERTLAWDDPDVAIGWPLRGTAPTVSAKDSRGTSLSSIESL
jgi:dTDP-4-dehydrorhamnose 3,5-epimerase